MILNKIVAYKRKELAVLKKKQPLVDLKKKVAALPKKRRIFLKALASGKAPAVIAEIKRRSPSKGLLRKNFDPKKIARDYQAGGASALSVLTDEKFFGGSADILRAVRREVKLPLLRKDFMIEEYQVYEARLMGADAILLIAAILSASKMKQLASLAEKLGMDALFEVHSRAELNKVKALKPRLLGVNNRNLKTFEVDIRTTEKLIKGKSGLGLIVSESGIQNHKDLLYLKGLGVRAVLVGETLMRQRDVKQALKRLRGVA